MLNEAVSVHSDIERESKRAKGSKRTLCSGAALHSGGAYFGTGPVDPGPYVGSYGLEEEEPFIELLSLPKNPGMIVVVKKRDSQCQGCVWSAMLATRSPRAGEIR